MGFLSEIRKLLWVKKAVAESAAEKAVDKGRELGEQVAEKASETWHKGKEYAEDLGEKITAKTRETFSDKPKDNWEPKSDWTQETSKITDDPKKETTAHKVGEKLGDAVEKVGDAAEKTWDKAKEEGKELLDKAVKVSDRAWEKAEEVSEDLWDKAKNLGQKASEKWNEGVDSMLEKAKELDKKIEEERKAIDPNNDGWADKTVREKMKEHESTLKGKDDFFERADRYASGDYSMGKPVVIKSEGDQSEDEEEEMTPLPPLRKDDIADDAILDKGDDDKA